MQSETAGLLQIQAPALLNLACFVANKAGLETHAGYLGHALQWPYQECGFRDQVEPALFIQAGDEWHQWWSFLKDERYQQFLQRQEDPDIAWITRGIPPSLDQWPALRRAVAWCWAEFWGWWLLPYAGGRMALEASVSHIEGIYQRLEAVAPGYWNWDVIFQSDQREMRYDGRQGWGLFHPNDLWNTDWMVPSAFT